MMAQGFWLSDTQWARLAPLLPKKPRGVPRVDDRRVISGIINPRPERRPGTPAGVHAEGWAAKTLLRGLAPSDPGDGRPRLWHQRHASADRGSGRRAEHPVQAHPAVEELLQHPRAETELGPAAPQPCRDDKSSRVVSGVEPI